MAARPIRAAAEGGPVIVVSKVGTSSVTDSHGAPSADIRAGGAKTRPRPLTAMVSPEPSVILAGSGEE